MEENNRALEELGKHGALPTRNYTLTTHPRYPEMGGLALRWNRSQS